MNNKAIIRLVITAILFINAMLTASGKNPIPFDESAVTEFLTQALSAIAIIWSWWKNNSFTHEAKLADEYMNELKSKRAEVGGEAPYSSEEDHIELDPEEV